MYRLQGGMKFATQISPLLIVLSIWSTNVISMVITLNFLLNQMAHTNHYSHPQKMVLLFAKL